MRKIVIGLVLMFAVFTFLSALGAPASPANAGTEAGIPTSQPGR